MNEHLLSKRLACVGSYVPNQARIADIGSDHAYLPVHLMLNEKISYAIAGEVVPGPYQSAKNQVQRQGLADRIDVRLADGLQAITPEDGIQVITIAGMGGSLIASILEEGRTTGKLVGVSRLVLQPNIGEEGLRSWLMAHHYQLVAEEIIEEQGKIYEIMVAEPTASLIHYTKKERLFGPFLMQQPTPVFLKKWQHEQTQKERVLANLQQAQTVPTEKLAQIQEELALIKELFV